jgi:hypothetical protein
MFQIVTSRVPSVLFMRHLSVHAACFLLAQPRFYFEQILSMFERALAWPHFLSRHSVRTLSPSFKFLHTPQIKLCTHLLVTTLPAYVRLGADVSVDGTFHGECTTFLKGY